MDVADWAINLLSCKASNANQGHRVKFAVWAIQKVGKAALLQRFLQPRYLTYLQLVIVPHFHSCASNALTLAGHYQLKYLHPTKRCT